MKELLKKISCVIPSYNEGKTIGNTLQAAIGASDFLHEIIVVNDASTDDTAAVVKNFPNVRLISNEKNQGKSRSIAKGILESSGQYFFMLDADLSGLKKENIIDLVKPILDDRADVTISIRANTPKWMKKIKVDFMSGERVIPREALMKHIEKIGSLKSFGLEVVLNRIIIDNKFRLETVFMKNVSNTFQWKKRNFLKGIYGEAMLWIDILKTVSPWELIRQNIELKQLLVNKDNP